ncbi:RpoB [Gossypium australe]|uniref:RpoB n=1 Tax=Gossypium australe TaxID=47621 RepID=A0A5B6TP23_9ROSI|nr:RpoB [Gossypium australe]
MLGDENGEMSTIPGLNQIQFEGFCGFMDRGLTEELYKKARIWARVSRKQKNIYSSSIISYGFESKRNSRECLLP